MLRGIKRAGLNRPAHQKTDLPPILAILVVDCFEKRAAPTFQTECNLVYQYDASGAIIGFTYYPSSGTASQYFFGKNAQGDVICIYDANGATVARYNYDAWGACTVAYDHSIIDVADINPIRYRSYYYDTETGWYYLQSRYYDPAVGRFISPDDPSLLGANGDLLSYNLYAYCSNNPVNYSDPSGQGFFTGLIIATIGVFIATVSIGALDGGISAAASGQSFWKGFAAGAISSLPSAVIVAASIYSGNLLPLATSLKLRFFSSLIYNYLNEIFQYGTLDNANNALFWSDAFLDVALSQSYYPFADELPGKVISTIFSGFYDGVVDITQTMTLYSVQQSEQNYFVQYTPANHDTFFRSVIRPIHI